MERFCIAGLGNPGAKYRHTRHNIGFDWIDAVVAELSSGDAQAAKPQSKFESEYWKFQIPGKELHFLKPLTFMNDSGRALRSWADRFQGESRFLIVFDEMDLPLGKLRLRASGSDGGHRGMRSVIERLGTSEIPRLRIGIGRPKSAGEIPREEVVDFVLQKFKPDEKILVSNLLKDASDHLKAWMDLPLEKAMNILNSKAYSL